MLSLAACRCPFRLMRRCFLGRWICLLVSEGFRQVWWCHLFDLKRISKDLHPPHKYIYHQVVLIAQILSTLFLTIRPYSPLLLVNLQGGIKRPHRADEVFAVGPYWCVHIWETIREVRLRIFLCFFSCLVRLTWMVCKMGGKWPYRYGFRKCCFYDLSWTWCSIFVLLSSCFFSKRFVKAQVVQTFSSTDMGTAWKNYHFILSERSDFHMIETCR